MTDSPFFRHELQGDILIVTVLGDVGSLADMQVLKELNGLSEHLQRGRVKHIVVDFSHIDYFGSSLLEALRALWKQAAARSGTLALCGLSQVGREVIETSRLDTLWPIYRTRSAAVTALQPATNGGGG
jgi:anti-anti-sigma factor